MIRRLPLPVLGGLLFVLLFLLQSSLFVVMQTEQALVLRFGGVRATLTDPGLHFKLPLVEEVVRYDARLLDLDLPPEQVILADQKRIVIDTYTRYRIRDALQFYQAVRNEEAARARLREIVTNAARRTLGNYMLPAVLSPERETIMRDIETQTAEAAKPLGIEIIDVRLRRADLPEETSQAIYKRMESERHREAAEARAQGYERAQQISSSADRERTVILAEAQRDAQILRGQGEGDANRIYAEAFGQDPAFFSFYRSLQAYRTGLGDQTSYVLSPDSEFLKYLSRGPERR